MTYIIQHIESKQELCHGSEKAMKNVFKLISEARKKDYKIIQE